ncbi:type II secretion system protein GspL [Hydrogenophaga sp.]|uniref:type II secretion system protein GspL n=1 Tax=Hydrogenophaga sp. TaxID=1904254 RepID=UPI0035669044
MLILTPPEFSTSSPADATASLSWVRSPNGLQASEHGQCAVSLLPRDDDVVLVLPPRAVSWHRLTLPKVASARLRAVLDGMLEDRVLADCAELHFALQPGGRSGQTAWIAACDKAWLRNWLQVLETAGRPVSRIVPAIWPLMQTEPLTDTTPLESLHWAHEASDQAWLATASVFGVSLTPLRENVSSRSGESTLSSLLPTASGALPSRAIAPVVAAAGGADRYLADPSVVALAEHALNENFEPLPLADWLLRCAQSDWNLAQFDFSLSSGARRGQRWRQLFRQLRSAPAWRPARWGLTALVAVQLAGLNAAAWHERGALKAKEQAIQQTLRQSFPQITLVLDAPVQMQRELARMQKAGGALTASDLETMLAALDRAPDAPVAPGSIQFSTGEGRFKGWPPGDTGLQTLQQALQNKGWQAQLEGEQLSLRPGSL